MGVPHGEIVTRPAGTVIDAETRRRGEKRGERPRGAKTPRRHRVSPLPPRSNPGKRKLLTRPSHTPPADVAQALCLPCRDSSRHVCAAVTLCRRKRRQECRRGRQHASSCEKCRLTGQSFRLEQVPPDRLPVSHLADGQDTQAHLLVGQGKPAPTRRERWCRGSRRFPFPPTIRCRTGE